MAFEIIVCKSGREGGCGSANSIQADIERYEMKQQKLGNTVVERTFCNQQMCSPRDANIEALSRLESMGFIQVTGVLITGTLKNGVEYDKAPGVVLRTPDDTLISEMF